MKKISKWYFIAAALLLAWALLDCYHYFFIGRGLVADFDGLYLMRSYVNRSLLQAALKTVLAAGILFLGWRKTKEKKRPRALTAITVRFAALVVGLWLLAMGCATIGVSSYVYDYLYTSGRDLAQYCAEIGRLEELYEDDGYDRLAHYPGLLEHSVLEGLRFLGVTVHRAGETGYYRVAEELPNVFANGGIECDTAVAVYKPDGSLLLESGDYVFFGYWSEEAYWAGDEAPLAGYAWLDLGDETDRRYSLFRTTYNGTNSLYDVRVIRATGYFDGARFEPLAMAIVSETLLYEALDQREPESHIVHPDGSEEIHHSYTYAQLEQEGVLRWQELFDHTADAPAGKELVTIYGRYPSMTVYEPHGRVIYQNLSEHESLLALLKTMDRYIVTEDGTYSDSRSLHSSASVFSLKEMIVFSEYPVYDLRGYDESSDEPFPEPELIITAAVRGSPLLIAMRLLKKVYLVTFAFAALGILLLRSSIKKNLLSPLREINSGIGADFEHRYDLRHEPPRWAEPYELSEHYFDTQDRLRMSKNEVGRLHKALDYAKAAEQNRRQMVSNIAHELKTPLAVIHSYAEGLKEHIAEEKREKYVDVILSEAERTDAMVLEMLDLSRLEAGKVKLSRDEFELAALVKAVFEKLEMAAAAKELTVSFDFPEKSTVTADENRMAQVIENFASNAVKYTPRGGGITVRIRRSRGLTEFSVENDSEPLSDEALTKVFESFYRTDEARSGGGTGLGLAIAKNIVELHGGKCAVRNTKRGVEFSFTV